MKTSTVLLMILTSLGFTFRPGTCLGEEKLEEKVVKVEKGSEKEKEISDSLEDFKKHYQIDSKFKAGKFLVYSCEGLFYACVDEDGMQLCKNRRQDSVNKEILPLACAPLKRFDSYDECFEKNIEYMNTQPTVRFCYPKAAN